MRYQVLATDFDGTIATHGRVDDDTRKALLRLKASGRRLVLVTGRELEDLQRMFAPLGLFDLLVLENGAVLHDPATRRTGLLCSPAAAGFVAELERRGVTGLSVGRSVVATHAVHASAVLEAIHELGLDLQLVFNRDALMILPPRVDKASGLATALARLGLSAHSTVGVGDAENDHPLLALCERGVAVANAVPALKVRADLVTRESAGAGVAELVERLVGSDVSDFATILREHGAPRRAVPAWGTAAPRSTPSVDPSFAGGSSARD